MALGTPPREGRYSSPRVSGSGVVPAHPRPRASMNVRVSRKDSREYLRLHQLEPYFEDVARQALERGDRPAERMRTYFRRVLAMRAVAGREYAFVSATVRAITPPPARAPPAVGWGHARAHARRRGTGGAS